MYVCHARTLLQNVFSLAVSGEEKLDSEEWEKMSSLCTSNNNRLAEQRSYTPFGDESRQLICNERISRSEREDFLKGTAGKNLFQLRGERLVLLKYSNVHLPHNPVPQWCKYQNV